MDFNAVLNPNQPDDRQPGDIPVIHPGMTILLPVISQPIVVHVVTDQANGSFLCSVAASSHPNYQVGGYDIVVSEAQLRRGTLIDPQRILRLALDH